MPRGSQFRYQEIADDLRERIATGLLPAAKLLPSESDLCAEHRASRVTVRRALDALREEGLIDSRQGFGWFVAAGRVPQTLVRLGTMEAQLSERGLSPQRRILDFGFVRAPRRAREILAAQTVLQVRRINLADDSPFARVTVWVPEDLAYDLSRAAVERSSFYEALPVVLARATQTIAAAIVSEDDASVLEVPNGSAVLVCERITYSTDGRAVLCSEFVFPAHRTEFVVELLASELASDHEPFVAPTGLRLVE